MLYFVHILRGALISVTFIYLFYLSKYKSIKLDKSYFFPVIEYIFWVQKTKDCRVKFNRKNSIFNKVIWDFNPDRDNKFPAPFPIELPMNCILSCTDENDIV